MVNVAPHKLDPNIVSNIKEPILLVTSKGRTCPCKYRATWRCSPQLFCPEAGLGAMREHDISIIPVELIERDE